MERRVLGVGAGESSARPEPRLSRLNRRPSSLEVPHEGPPREPVGRRGRRTDPAGSTASGRPSAAAVSSVPAQRRAASRRSQAPPGRRRRRREPGQAHADGPSEEGERQNDEHEGVGEREGRGPGQARRAAGARPAAATAAITARVTASDVPARSAAKATARADSVAADVPAACRTPALLRAPAGAREQVRPAILPEREIDEAAPRRPGSAGRARRSRPVGEVAHVDAAHQVEVSLLVALGELPVAQDLGVLRIQGERLVEGQSAPSGRGRSGAA